MWLVITTYTVRGAVTGKIFNAPRLGKESYQEKPNTERISAKNAKEDIV